LRLGEVLFACLLSEFFLEPGDFGAVVFQLGLEFNRELLLTNLDIRDNGLQLVERVFVFAVELHPVN